MSLPATAVPRPFAAAGIVLLGLVCQDVGASFAVKLFPAVGPIGMVALRLGFSAIVLLAIFRPRMRGRSPRDWLTVVLFGLAVAVMNALFYEALDRIPLGATLTIEILGPLVLSIVTSRRASSWLWAVLAFGGVAILGGGGFGALDPVGVAFAAGAAVMWTGYILLSARTGQRFERLDGLAIAMTVGAVVTIPFGILTAGSSLVLPVNLGLGLAVALLSSTIPYAFELFALRRIPSSTFAILMSLSPGIATIAGFLILGQQATIVAVIAVALVIAASIGAVLTASRPLAEPQA